MAFTYCTNCGEKIDMSEGRCPHCGYMRASQSSYGEESYRESPRPQGGQSSYGYGGQGGYNQQGGYNPYGQRPMYRVPTQPVKRPISKGLLIFSIINIAFAMLTTTSLIFGIIALIYTVNARSAQSEAEEISKKKKALIINIVGLVIGFLSLVSFTVLLIEAIKELANSGNI